MIITLYSFSSYLLFSAVNLVRLRLTFCILRYSGKGKRHEVTKDYDIANYFYEDGELAHGNVAADVDDLVAELRSLCSKDTE